MNPANWFKKDDDSAAQPITRSSLPPRTEPIRSAPPASTATPATAPLRVIPRYAYRKELALPAGNRKEAEKFFAQATAAFGQKRWPEAISLYKKAISVDPSYFDAQYNLGLAAYRNKDLPLALAADEQAVALKPNSIDARFNFAATLRDAHYYADAAKELRELLSVAPNEVRAHLALASLYAQQLDDRALARQHYQRVLELEPNHPEAASIRQWLAFTQ
jgi:tetratricopeptide (TPR) repeat protein